MSNTKEERQRRRKYLIENHERVIDMNSLFELVNEMFENGMYAKSTVNGDAVSHTLRGIYHVRNGQPERYGIGMRDHRGFAAFESDLLKKDYLSKDSFTVEFGRWKKIHGR